MKKNAKIFISLELVDKINDLITEANVSIGSGMGALLWLSALAAQQSGLNKENYVLISGDLYDQVLEEEKKASNVLN